MNAKHPVSHRWDLSPKEAIALQKELAGQVILRDELPDITHVAGVDVGFENNGGTTRAAIAVLSYPQLILVDHAVARLPTSFPYVPGLLSFREIPAVLAALEQIRIEPQLILCDGQGLAHPRRLGIACHLGLLTGIATIGVAKSRLIGSHNKVPDKRGAWVSLKDKEETIGAVLRSRQGVKPLYISAGHKVSLKSALEYVMACTTRYRLPETTRWAHRLASGTADQIERALRRQTVSG